jgi:DNA-binding MarR family transcriptional regulator
MTSLAGASSPEVHGFAYEAPDCGGGGEDNGRSTEIGRGRLPKLTDHDLQKIIDARRLRARFFEDNLFADPAWDILLDLYRAHLAQQRICVTSVCFGAGVPVSTALRWLNALEERNLAKRSQDPLDGRRYFVELTDKGVSAMAGYFAAGARPLAL